MRFWLDFPAIPRYNSDIRFIPAEVTDMNLFESDNIWKRKARQERQALHPMTAHETWEKELRSNYLWLIGGILVTAMSAAAIAAGAMALSLTTGVVIFMVVAYCVMTAKQISTLKKNEPELTAAEKKQLRKKK